MKIHFGKRKGEIVELRQALVGCSRRDVSVEEHSLSTAPVTWHFIAGRKHGGDNLEREPALVQYTFEVDGAVDDVIPALERRLGIDVSCGRPTWQVLLKT